MASRSIGQLTLDLIAKIGGFRTGMDQAARIADSRSRAITKAMSGVSRSIAGLFAGLSAGLVVRKLVQETSEAETSFAELESAIRATGGAAGFTSDQLSGFADTLAKETRFDDENIQDGITVLLRFGNVVGDEFTRATRLGLDLATVLKTDVPTAMKLMGQALNDPVKGITKLYKAGVDLDNSQEKLIKDLLKAGDVARAQGVLMDSLANIQGRAADSADTLGGRIDQAKVAFDNLFEVTGEGSDDAKAAVEDLIEVLNDPATKRSANELAVTIFTGFANAARAITAVTESLRILGGGATDIEELEDQLQFLKRIRDDKFDLPILFNFGYIEGEGVVLGPDAVKRKIREIESELERLRKLNDAARPDGTPVPGETSRSNRGDEDEDKNAREKKISDYERIKRQLEEQLALMGQVGEAAKIRYQVEHGEIDDLTKAQGKYLIGVAEQIDAKGDLIDRVKEQARAEEDLKQAVQDQVNDYRKQLALLGGDVGIDINGNVAATIKTWDGYPAVKNADGSYSTRLTATVEVEELNAGAVTNIPTIWEGQILAVDAAIRKAVESGLQFPKFDSIDEAVAAAQQLSDNIGTSLDYELALKRASSDLTEVERLRIEMTLGGLRGINAADRERLENIAAQIDAQNKLNTDLAAAKGIYEQTLTPLEKYQNQLAEIARLQASGAFDTLGDPATIAARAAQQAAEDFKHATDEVNTFTDQAKRNMQDLLAGFLSDPFSKEIDQVLLDFGRMLAEMAAQAIAADIASKIFGDGGSHLAADFGNFILGLFKSAPAPSGAFVPGPGGVGPVLPRDSGGQGYPGHAYLIGRGAQPELFVPDVPGTFVPNWEGTQRQENHFTFMFGPGSQPASRLTQLQLANSVGRAVAEANRRNG